MSLNLSKTVADFLAKHPEQKFTARQIAQWMFQQFPAECKEKKANSKTIKDDDDLGRRLIKPEPQSHGGEFCKSQIG
jgi:uncharacterized protein